MNKKKNDLKFIFIFIVVATISLLYLANTSYARYKRKVDATVQNRIANWNIKVNNELITNKSTLSQKITPVLDSSEYVKEGTLAPGTTGHFDIVINASNVDVDFNYTIVGETDQSTQLRDLKLTKFDVNGEEHNFGENNELTGELKKNTGDTPIRIYFEWNDDEDNLMDNKKDTEYAANASLTGLETKIKVSIIFSQKNG